MFRTFRLCFWPGSLRGTYAFLPHITDRGQHRYIGDKLVVILQLSMAEGLHFEAFYIPILACSMSQSPGFSISTFVSPTVRGWISSCGSVAYNVYESDSRRWVLPSFAVTKTFLVLSGYLTKYGTCYLRS
jgi:hypothetical protein